MWIFYGIVGSLAFLCTACGGNKTDYTLGEAAYARGNYQASADIFESHSGAFNSRKDGALYYTGMSKINSGDIDGGLKDLKDVARGASSRSLRAQALAAQGQTHLKTNDPAEAETEFAKILEEYRADYPEEDALGGLMQAKAAKGDTTGAEAVRAELARKYPGSPYLARTTGAALRPGSLFKVRLSNSFANRAAAQAEAGSLKRKGIGTMLVAQPQGAYGIQVGAFSSQAHAQARIDSLKAYGYTAQIVSE